MRILACTKRSVLYQMIKVIVIFMLSFMYNMLNTNLK